MMNKAHKLILILSVQQFKSFQPSHFLWRILLKFMPYAATHYTSVNSTALINTWDLHGVQHHIHCHIHKTYPQTQDEYICHRIFSLSLWRGNGLQCNLWIRYGFYQSLHTALTRLLQILSFFQHQSPFKAVLSQRNSTGLSFPKEGENTQNR